MHLEGREKHTAQHMPLRLTSPTFAVVRNAIWPPSVVNPDVGRVKVTEAIIAKGDAGAMKISARNTVSGGVTHIEKGPAMTAVTLDAQNWKLVTAITSQAAEDL